MPDRRVNIANLGAHPSTDIKAYKSKLTKEAEIRQQLIDPFWRATGWDVGDTKGVGWIESKVIIEKNVETMDAAGLRSRRPDYVFRLGDFARFSLGGKTPGIPVARYRVRTGTSTEWSRTLPHTLGGRSGRYHVCALMEERIAR